MTQAANSTQEDIRAIMAQVKHATEEKQRRSRSRPEGLQGHRGERKHGLTGGTVRRRA
jgi:hypothetical protein